MKIGIDVDDVLASYLDSFLRFYNKKNGTAFIKEEFKSYGFEDTLGGTHKDSLKRIEEFHLSVDFDDIQPVEDSQFGVESLVKKDELHVITSRQPFLKSKTNRWLGRYYGDSFSSVTLTGDCFYKNKSTKSDICESIGADIIIEDSLEHALPCSEKGIEVLLLDNPWNKSEKINGIQRIYGWKEIIEYFK